MKITRIEKSKKRKSYYDVYLDGKYSFTASYKHVYGYNLKEGMELDEFSVKNLVYRIEYDDAKDYILKLLNRKMYTEHEIKQKLKKKGYRDDVVTNLVYDMKGLELVDDSKYTSMWIEEKVRLKPMGIKRMMYELEKKGIDKETIKMCLDKADIDEYSLAKRVLNKKFRKNDFKKPKDSRRAYNLLLRRGFSYDVIKRVVSGE